MRMRALAFLVLIVLAVFGIPTFSRTSPQQNSQPGAAAGPTRVRVEHELVQPEVIAESAPARYAEAPRDEAPRAEAPRAGRRPARKQTREEGFASRAGRLLLGDGRYRPEPFPRGRQH